MPYCAGPADVLLTIVLYLMMATFALPTPEAVKLANVSVALVRLPLTVLLIRRQMTGLSVLGFLCLICWRWNLIRQRF